MKLSHNISKSIFEKVEPNLIPEVDKKLNKDLKMCGYSI
jgi:hypothetical protein